MKTTSKLRQTCCDASHDHFVIVLITARRNDATLLQNLIVFTPSGVSGTVGAITSTSTTSRQVQFGLKLTC